MPSLSSRMEAADANAHTLRATLAVTEAAIPTPIFRANPPTLSRDGSASRDHSVTEPATSSMASLSASRATTRSIGKPSAARSCRAASTSLRAAMTIRTSTAAASSAPASAANPYTTSLAGQGDMRAIWLRVTAGGNRRALARVRSDAGQERARLRRHGYSPYENLVGREFENDEIVVDRALDIFGNFHPRGQGRENVSCLSVAQHRISGRLGPPNHDMFVLARDNQRTTFAPAVTPGQKQCREDFDPSFPDSADVHCFAFGLIDDPLEEPWGWYRGPDKYAIG